MDEGKSATHDHLYVHYTSMLELKRLSHERGSISDEDEEVRLEIRTKVQQFELQRLRYVAAKALTDQLHGTFSQLEKVARSLLTTQEELGDELTRTRSGIAKLTINIKCVDSIWRDIIALYDKLKEVKDGIADAKTKLPGIEGHVRTEILEMPDGNRNQEPQQILIIDPNPPTTNEENVSSMLNRIEEIDDADGTESADATLPPSSTEPTILEDLDDECDLETASQDPEASSATDETMLKMMGLTIDSDDPVDSDHVITDDKGKAKEQQA